MSKKVLLAIVLLVVIGAISYLEAIKPRAPASAPEAVSLVPTAPPAAATSSSTAQTATLAKTEKTAKSQAERIKEKSRLHPPAVDLVTPAGFINTEKFSLRDLIGKKIVLIDFWTYSCINCIRELPYIKSWYEKYRDQGLEIVGVHTPEFEFEHDYGNVSAAVKKFGITYPVVLDNDYGTWNAYRNQYWPHLYLIDIDGFIVYDKIGEGGYDETEKEIQKALAERAEVLGVNMPTVKNAPPPPEDLSHIGSPETYFGANRNGLLANGAAGTIGEQTLNIPATIQLNSLYLSGTWDIEQEYAENKNVEAKIIFKYNAKNVYLVAGAEKDVYFTVWRDGKAVGDLPFAGSDVKLTRDGDGRVVVREERLYKIIEDSQYGEHTLELRIENPGLKTFTFTFG